ncbi:MAG: hypothetical protein EHM32_05550 [Spirochaetales bacterium]|nr:MAG: hypothetical protein EHM32_05550 [Spirochaetales bacterium]
MKKSIVNEDVFYTIAWSRLIAYEKHSASRILPEMPGILCLLEAVPRGAMRYLIFYGCWRDGLRMALKNFLDPDFTKFPDINAQLRGRTMQYKYTVVDSSMLDMQDVMFWLIRTYEPEFNALGGFEDSKRYKNISIREMELGTDQVIERLPKTGL